MSSDAEGETETESPMDPCLGEGTEVEEVEVEGREKIATRKEVAALVSQLDTNEKKAFREHLQEKDAQAHRAPKVPVTRRHNLNNNAEVPPLFSWSDEEKVRREKIANAEWKAYVEHHDRIIKIDPGKKKRGRCTLL